MEYYPWNRRVHLILCIKRRAYSKYVQQTSLSQRAYEASEYNRKPIEVIIAASVLKILIYIRFRYFTMHKLVDGKNVFQYHKVNY